MARSNMFKRYRDNRGQGIIWIPFLFVILIICYCWKQLAVVCLLAWAAKRAQTTGILQLSKINLWKTSATIVVLSFIVALCWGPIQSFFDLQEEFQGITNFIDSYDDT